MTCTPHENTPRPDLDKYFMEIAEVVAKRSTCLHHKVGAVLVRDGQILTTGYNGAPSKIAHCIELGCARDGIESGTRHELCRAVHAEQNAIIQAALHGVCTKGATLYCTHQPCILCAKMIINAGVKRVCYGKDYPDQAALKMLIGAGIETSNIIWPKDDEIGVT